MPMIFLHVPFSHRMKKIIPFNKVELWTAGTSMLKTVKTSKKKKLNCYVLRAFGIETSAIISQV